MLLNSMIKEMQKSMMADMPQETINSLMEANKKVDALRIEASAVKTGSTLNDFTLQNHLTESINLYETLKKGAVILNFYRGSWCPYCNLELNALQSYLKRFRQNGAELIAVTPELPSGITDTVIRHQVDFNVLSDIDNKLARSLGLVFRLPEELCNIYRGFGIDLEKYNGNDHWELAVPATLLVSRDATVVSAFINSDYTQRAEPEQILSELKLLNREQD